MDSYEFVIVGSGPAGVAAARRLDVPGACIVDVGADAAPSFPHGSLSHALDAGDISSLLGQSWEMLANLVYPNSVHAKLRAKGLRHAAAGCPFTVFDAAGAMCLAGAGSYAAGGMSIAWGAQLFRYTAEDIAEAGDWPIGVQDLSSYFDDLEAHIGIAGELDQMAEFLGKPAALLPPAPIVPSAANMLLRHQRLGRNTRLLLGRSRLAVLTQPHRGYDKYGFGGLEFFVADDDGVYSAKRTLRELRARGRVAYLGGHEVIGFSEKAEFVEVKLLHHSSGSVHKIRAKHLLLGCGTLHTTRLVVQNKQASGKPLPFVDHPPTLLPLFLPRLFGTRLPATSFPVQLVATLGGYSSHDMISFYYPGGMLWSDLLPEMPFPMDTALAVLPQILGGMLVAQIWEVSRPAPENSLTISEDGSIRIRYSRPAAYPRLSALLAELRRLGAFSHSALAKMSPPGWGFHYAACLPMSKNPLEFQTHIDGRLWDSKRIRVVDGSVLPSLPAKNHSLTLMANAARIADEASKCGY